MDLIKYQNTASVVTEVKGIPEQTLNFHLLMQQPGRTVFNKVRVDIIRLAGQKLPCAHDFNSPASEYIQ